MKKNIKDAQEIINSKLLDAKTKFKYEMREKLCKQK